jgi:hypothetical protein
MDATAKQEEVEAAILEPVCRPKRPIERLSRT